MNTSDNLVSAARDGIVIAHTTTSQQMATKACIILQAEGITNISTCFIEGKKFHCGEYYAEATTNVRSKAVYLFFRFTPGNYSREITELSIILNALHLAGVGSITLITPFLPYLRQDRKDKSRTAISAAVIIRTLELCRSLTRVVTIDMHADQLQAVFTIPTDHLPGRTVMREWIAAHCNHTYDDVVFVAPDFGSAKRVRKLAEMFVENPYVALLEKRRTEAGSEVMNIIGDSVAGKTCVLNDDILDTGGTILNAINALYAHGAKSVVVTATHAVLSPSGGTTAYQKLASASAQVVVTDSLPTENHDWLTVLPLAEYLARVIKHLVSTDGSISTLIEKGLEHD